MKDGESLKEGMQSILIESQWNLNVSAYSGFSACTININRITVEFKLITQDFLQFFLQHINRITVEFKFQADQPSFADIPSY